MKKYLFSFYKVAVLAVLLFGFGKVSGQTTLLSENFSSASSGDNTSTTNQNTVWSGNVNIPAVVKAFQAGNAVKIGSGSGFGSLKSKALNLSTDGGTFTVTFDVKGWSSVEGDITVSVTGLTSQTASYISIYSDSFETKTLTFTGGTAGSTVTIATTLKRAFIDNIVIATVPAGHAVTTTAATSISTTGATLNGTINANGVSTASSFEYGLTASYGASVAATPSPVTGITTTNISASISSLSVNTLYHFRAIGTVGVTVTNGTDKTFYTLANTPTAPTVTNPTVSTLDVKVGTTDGNPAATVYAINETGGQFVQADGSLGATAVWQTAAAWGTKTITGLTASTTYTFKTKARNGDTTPVETAYSGTTSATTSTPATLDYWNLESPANTGILEGGTSENIYAQAYKAGATGSSGPLAGLQVWIGYSSTNNNPGLSGWTWVAATYSGISGNNDEYKANLGTGLTPGTYYYASRFQLSGGAYTYGGLGNAWNATTNPSGVLTVNSNKVDYANIQSPNQQQTRNVGETIDVLSRVYEPGSTTLPGNGSGDITGWIGYSTKNPTAVTDFTVITGPDQWNWILMVTNPAYNTSSPGYEADNDEYWVQNFGQTAGNAFSNTGGIYYYVSRYQKSGSTEYVYGANKFLGNNNEGNIFDGTTYVAGKLTIIPKSTASDIVVKTGYTYPQNIPYATKQATNIINDATSIEIAQFTIRDGGATADADNLGTTLNTLTLNITNSANIRRIALYDGTAEIGTEQAGASTVTFSGLTLATTDGGTKDFSVRVSFNAAVTDNQQIDLTIAATTTAATTGSTFAATNAGGAITSNALDNNRIEVTADRLAFTTQPVTTAVNVVMGDVVISASDIFANTDLDIISGTVSLTSSGTMTGTPLSATFSGGNATFSGIMHTVAGTGYNLSSTGSGLITATSTLFDITDVPLGTYKTTTDSGLWINGGWEQLTLTGWSSVTAPTSGTTDLILINNDITLNSGNWILKFITINSGGRLTQSATGGLTIISGGKLLVKNGGKYFNVALTKFGISPTATFEIEDDGTVYNSYQSQPLSENLFLGKEIFHSNSNFIIQNADNNKFLTDFTVLTPFNDGNGKVGYFGNIIYETGGNSVDLIYGASGTITAVAPLNNITNGDLIFRSGTASLRLIAAGSGSTTSTTSSSTKPYGIGGNLIIESAYTGAITFRNTSTPTYFKIDNDLKLNGDADLRMTGGIINTSINLYVSGDINIADNSQFIYSTAVNNTSPILSIYLKGNLKVALNAKFTNLNTASNNGIIFFNGAGDGKSSYQSIDSAPESGSNSKINFKIVYPATPTVAYVKLLNNNLVLGTNSTFTVNNGGTLDFGFNGTNGINISRVLSPTLTSGQAFTAETGSTLKITSPLGITKDADYSGNVQIGATALARFFDPNSTYHYIGKVPQVSGNGLPLGITGKVIVDLDANNLIFKASGNKTINTAGTLEIRNGIVEDTSDDSFGDAAANTGKLTMTGGRYRIFKGSTQPDLSGTYNLTAGVIEYAGSLDKTIRSPKAYQNIEVTGNEVGNSNGNITLNDNGSFTVKTAGIFKINDDAIVGESGIQTVTVEDGGVFRTGDAEGFSGSNQTSIQPSVENIVLAEGSTIEYSRANNQTITSFQPLEDNESNIDTGGYYNLKLTGDNGTLAGASSKTLSSLIPVFVRNTVEVAAQARLTIDADKSMIVKNNIINNGGSARNFIVKSDGNLRQINDAIINSTAIAARRLHTLTGERKQYNYISAPVKNQDMKLIFGDVATNVLYVTVLNEATNFFVNAKTADYGIAARGFSVREPKTSYTGVPLGGGANDISLNEAEYKGVPNNGFISRSLSYSGGDFGYNVIGNPYPSNLDIVDLYNNSYNGNNNDPDIRAEFKFWDNSINKFYTQMGGGYAGWSYAIFNVKNGTNGLGTKAPGNPTGTTDPNNPNAPVGSKIPNRVIKVSQAFMVRALKSGAVLKFNNTQRKVTNTGTPFFGKDSPDNYYRLELMTPDSLVIQNAVSYFAGGNAGIGIEDSKIPNATASDAIFNMVEDEKLIINGNPLFTSDHVVKLGTRNSKSGTYQIRAIDQSGIFANGQSIYLKDKQLGILADLTAGAYIFSSESGEFTNRFEIVYTEGVVLATDIRGKSKIEVYRDMNDFVIRSSEKAIIQVVVYDASGRLVMSLSGNSKEIRFTADRLVEGMYVLKTTLADEEKITKKIRK